MFSDVSRRGSRCRRTGMAPELPGSRRTCPSTEERNLMRRASTCLALLGLAVSGPTGRRVGGADGHAQGREGRAHPGASPPAPATSSAPVPPSKPNTRSKAPNTGGVPSPLTGVNFSCPAGAKLTHGFVTCPPATLENIGPKWLPEEVEREPVGSAGVRQLRQQHASKRTRRCRRSSPRRRPAVLRQRRLADLGPAELAGQRA